MKFKTVAFVASPQKEAREAGERLKARYPNIAPTKADLIVAVGGDGFLLQTLHKYMRRGIPIYGMNRGSIGFLMNVFPRTPFSTGSRGPSPSGFVRSA